jgi:hypothetical protein
MKTPKTVRSRLATFIFTINIVTILGTPLIIPASQLLATDSDPKGCKPSISAVGTPVNGGVVLNLAAQTVTFVAHATGPASINYRIMDALDLTSAAPATVSLTANAAGRRMATLFTATTVPDILTASDASAVELGVKFQSSVAGRITAIRFYKGPQNTGRHTAHLWSATGASLATATFAGETASGWQQVNLTTPVAITPNKIYVASYHATKGHYSAAWNYFAKAHVSDVLAAPATSNGVYFYGTTSKLPTSTFNASNYYVDVVFVSP